MEVKLLSTLGAPRITEQSRRHGSSARCVRDPMTQGYWPGGVVVTWRQGSRLGAQDRSSSFLVVPYWTHGGHNPPNTSCAPWSAGQLGAGRIHYRRVCICVLHGKQRRSPETRSWYLSYGNIFSIVVLWRSKPSLRFLYSNSSRNSSTCPPLLSLPSPPRPRFCAEDLPKPCWSTLRRGQPSTCY